MTERGASWEYRVLTVGSIWGTKDEQVEDTLNELGEEGWEAIGVQQIENSSKIRIVAKRPLTLAARRERSMPGIGL